MKDKKLADLTTGDVGKILCWSLGIAFAIAAVLTLLTLISC